MQGLVNKVDEVKQTSLNIFSCLILLSYHKKHYISLIDECSVFSCIFMHTLKAVESTSALSDWSLKLKMNNKTLIQSQTHSINFFD